MREARGLRARTALLCVGIVALVAACGTASHTTLVGGERVFVMSDAHAAGECGDQASCAGFSMVRIDDMVYVPDKFGPPGRAVGAPGSGQLFAVREGGSRHCWTEARTITGVDPRTFVSVHGAEPCGRPATWFVARSIGR